MMFHIFPNSLPSTLIYYMDRDGSQIIYVARMTMTLRLNVAGRLPVFFCYV